MLSLFKAVKVTQTFYWIQERKLLQKTADGLTRSPWYLSGWVILPYSLDCRNVSASSQKKRKEARRRNHMSPTFRGNVFNKIQEQNPAFLQSRYSNYCFLFCYDDLSYKICKLHQHHTLKLIWLN